jgi:hypothetical protein
MKTKVLIVIALCCSGALAQDSGDFNNRAFTPDDAALAKATAACGPDKVKFDVTNPDKPEPAAVLEKGKALVYMIEDAELLCGPGCGVTTKVGLNGGWVGANQGGSYFSFSVEPGEQHLCVKWQSRVSRRNQAVAVANLTAEAGKTYYFRTRVFDNNYSASVDLDPITSDQGRLLMASFPLSISHVKR